MRRQLVNINAFFEKIPDRVKKVRKPMWLLLIGLTVLAVIGLGRFTIDMSWNVLFKPDEPVKIAYDRFRAVFGSDETLYLVYEAKDGDVFSEKSLRTLKKLHDEFETLRMNQPGESKSELSHITRVTSLINVSYLEGSEESLISRDFVGDNIPTSTAESNELRAMACSHPDYPRLFCSSDSKYGGILLRTDFNAEILSEDGGIEQPGNTELEFSFDTAEEAEYSSPLDGRIPNFKTTLTAEYVPFTSAVYDVIKKEEYTEHFTFYPAGNTELMGFIGKELMKEFVIIILVSMVLILTVLGILFRSISAVIWSFMIIILSILWTLGTVGWSGLSMSDFVNIIVFLLIAVGVADSVHILSGYLYFRRQGEEHESAVRSVYRKSGFACFLTSITTATGLLALSFAPIVAVQRLAYFGAIGVLYAFFITVFMLPLMLEILRPKVKVSRQVKDSKNMVQSFLIQRIIARFDKFSTTRPGRKIFAFIVAGILLVPGISRIQVDSNMLTIIREDKPIRKNFAVVDREMAGTGNIEVLIDTGKPDGMKDPLVLNAVDTFQRRLEHDFPDIVYKTISLANVTKDSYKVLNENRQEMYIIPDDPDILAQTLFLFGSANPKDRRLLVSDDYRAARITVNTKMLGSQEGIAFMKEVNKLANEHFRIISDRYPEARFESTGQIPMFLRLMDLISWSQIQSFGICLLVISVFFLVFLGNIRDGLIAIFPNLFPILTVFGLMGWLGIPLDVHTLLVVPIIIGISVDDTVHFVTHYHLERRKNNSVYASITMAMREAGQAIIFTSLVLSIGYLVFLVCVNKGFAYFGFLSSVAVLTALLSDLVLLPALYSYWDKDTRENQ